MRFVKFTRNALVVVVATAFASAIAATPAVAGVPGSTSAINVDAHGVALGGYDPVAYFDTGRPTRNDQHIP